MVINNVIQMYAKDNTLIEVNTFSTYTILNCFFQKSKLRAKYN